MDFRGRYELPAAPEMVWAALHDPQVLHSCIPGCEGVLQVSDDIFQATATISVGPVKARFSGRVTWTAQPAPEGFTHAGLLSGEGQGGAAGFAKGRSEVRLAANNGTTILTYEAKASVGGKLAQVGQRLIDATARGIADSFFAKFASFINDKTEAPGTEPTLQPRQDQEGLKPQIWIAGLVAIVVLLLIVFSLVL